MRRANDRPTTIYWLVDVRPETQQAVRSIGFPFYCGKTVDTLPRRLAAHRDSANKHPHRRISQWLKACGQHVRVHVVAIIPTCDDWSVAERRWIEVIRSAFPGGANANSGGQGTPGMVHTAEARAKIGAANKGKTVSAETRARIGAASKGRKHPPESIARRAAKMRGRKRPNYGRKEKQPTSAEIARLVDSAAYRLIEKRRAKLLARRQASTSVTC